MRTNHLTPLTLLTAVALAVSVLMVLWSTLPAQAQSESDSNDTSNDQPTGKHLIAFSGNQLPQDYAERIAALGGSVEDGYSEIGVVTASGLTDEAAQSLGSDEDVEVVEQDVNRQWLDPNEEASAAQPLAAEPSAAEPSNGVTPASSTNPASAFFYPHQWNLSAIQADKAWQQGRLGSNKVTVAILDTGIDGGRNDEGNKEAQQAHPDVRGLVDKTRSKSFVPSDDKLVRANFPKSTPDWTDLHFHGTHVAATVSSNALAAAGVTSKVKLMAVKVLGVDGKGADSGILAGIMYAADNGADVINMSLEGKFSKSQSQGTVSVINRAINYANSKGTTMVVAAGNDNENLNQGSDLYRMFCESPHVVCVSATGPTSGGLNGPWTDVDAHAPYSNYGSPITVASPGGNGSSSVLAACSRTSLVQKVCQNGTFVLPLNGTSMAAPQVSGLAALLVEDIGKGRPSQVAAQIRKSADDVGDPGKDMYFGQGRINIANALRTQSDEDTQPRGKE